MDLEILQYINAHWHGIGFFNYFLKYISYLGNVGIFWIVLGLAGLIYKPTRKVAFIMLLALATEAFIVDIILKHAINRPRPYTKDQSFIEFYDSIHLKKPTSSSFPSGHTAASFVCAIVLVYYYRVKAIPAIVLAALIAFSRMFLCVHYPSDIIAGLAIAVVVATAAIIVARVVEQKWQQKHPQKKAD